METKQNVEHSTMVIAPKHSNATVTGGSSDIDTVIKIANEIYNKWLAAGVDLKDTTSVEAALDKYKKEYKDFNTSYPYVLQCMIRMKAYSPFIFRKYLVSLSQKPKGKDGAYWKDYDEQVIWQFAKYDRYIMKMLKPNISEKDLNKHYKETRKKLLAESATFQKEYTAAKAKVADEDAYAIQRMKEEIIKKAKLVIEEDKKKQVQDIINRSTKLF